MLTRRLIDPLAREGELAIQNGEYGVDRSFTVRIHQLQIEQVRLL